VVIPEHWANPSAGWALISMLIYTPSEEPHGGVLSEIMVHWGEGFEVVMITF
jgi:hypothetical protein